MDETTFESTMRTLMRRTPFRPFVVELADGQQIEIDAPESVAWGGGAAGYLRPDGEPVLFHCRDVRQIFPQTAETAS